MTGEAGAAGAESSEERLGIFSDAVVAIAMTLLALELPVPSGTTEEQVRHALWESGREYVAFLLSFWVIAALWTFHHRLLRHVVGFTPWLVVLNFIWLLGIVLVPFVTKFLMLDGAYSIGPISYAVVVGGTGLVLLLMIEHCRSSGLLRPGTPIGATRRSQLFLATPTAAFLLSIPVAVHSPDIAVYSWLVACGLTAFSARWAVGPGRPTATG